MPGPLTLSAIEIACDLAIIDNGGSIPHGTEWPEGASWTNMVHARERVKRKREQAVNAYTKTAKSAPVLHQEQTTEIERPHRSITWQRVSLLLSIVLAIAAVLLSALGY